MDGSCIEQESTTSGSPSVSFRQEQCSLAVKQQVSPPVSLCRMGSGTSVVLDLDGGNTTEAESGRRLPSSRFKGVVSQPNGRWGAQIYEKHQRVWLGTFNEEAEAARTYDVAAQRFRGRDAIVNFKPTTGNQTCDDDAESVFLATHSKTEIVDMLRKHTYKDELEQARKNIITHSDLKSDEDTVLVGFQSSDQLIRTSDRLFEKTVTPSDVGKLNRLVIPKQHAEKHFPLQNGSASKGVLLNLKDVNGKVWRFRYSYWNSSQSYVLTKGWSRFVKEKQLRAGDVVSFHRSACSDKQLFIDWKKKNDSDCDKTIEPVSVPLQPVPFRLFGVNIFKAPTIGDKRMREIDFFTLECKKPKYL